MAENNHTPIAELRPLKESCCTLKEFLSPGEGLPLDTTCADDLDLMNDSDHPPLFISWERDFHHIGLRVVNALGIRPT